MAKASKSSSVGGSATTEGLLYQAAVAVWASLELLLVQRAAGAIDIEPPSHEDAEAEVRPDEADGASASITLPAYRLVIQVKLRNTGPWSVNDLDSLLKRGERRTPAKDRMTADPRVRYLLVTSAAVSGGMMQSLQVSEIGEFPDSAPAAKTFAALADASGSRLAVLSADRWVVDQKIRRLLQDVCNVPHDRFDDCRAALEREALQRSRAGVQSVWTREALQSVLKAHGAYFSIGPDLDDYVPPDNWDALLAQAETGAVVITGQSGSGKTLTALKLCDELRTRVPGLKVVDVRTGPGEVNRLIDARPILFYLEDPWGRYRRVPDALPWNDELLRLLPKARGDLLFVITSRSDVLAEFGEIGKRLSPWTVSLNAETYGPAARNRLFENRLSRLPAPIQLQAVRAKAEALRTLETPLEIERYFVHLARGPESDETEYAFVARAMHAAHHTTFEDEVAATVMAREDIGWAALLWGMLKAAPALERDLFPKLRRPIQASVTRVRSTSLEGLVNLLVTGRSLKQPGTAISYAHPRVEAGFEQAMDADTELSGDVLEATLDALIGLDVAEGAIWGRRTAASILAAGVKERDAKNRPVSRVTASSIVQSAVDQYLEQALVVDGEDQFNETLQLAAGAGSAGSPLCELARWLLAREPVHRGWWVARWKMQARDDVWFEAIKADSRCGIVLDRFVRRTLTVENREYPASLLTHLARFGFDLTAAFQQAALGVVNAGYDGRADVIVAWAARNVAAAEPVARAAAAALAGSKAEPTPAERETDLAIANGDYDDEYTEHLATQDYDQDYVARAILDDYVPGLRRANGWRVLAASPVSGPGIDRWLKAVEESAPSRITTAELIVLQQRVEGGGDEERFARLAAKLWRPQLAAPLAGRILAADIEAAAWAANVVTLARHAPGAVLDAQAVWLADNEAAQVLRLHWAVLRGAPADAGRSLLLRRLRQDLPGPLAELSRALGSRGSSLSLEAAALLAQVSSADPDFNADLIHLGQARGVFAEAAVTTNLENWNVWRRAPAQAAMEAATAFQAWPVVDAGRTHPLADVRLIALDAWADRSPSFLEEVLDHLRDERSSKVISTLIRRLTATPTLAHLDHLLAMAANTWSEYSTPSGEGSYFPFARQAARALLSVEGLPNERLADIFRVGVQTEDPTVRAWLFAAIAHNSGETGRKRLIAHALKPAVKGIVRRAVVAALQLVAEEITPADLEALTSDVILNAPASLAVEFARLQALVQPESTLLELAAVLSSSNTRRVMVLLLNTGRHPTLGSHLARLLPPGHQARRIVRHPGARTRLARSSIDDLGDVRMVERVRQALADRFEEVGSESVRRKKPRRKSVRRAARRA